MIYPSIDKLLTVVDSKYKLVHIAASRSNQMNEKHHYQLSDNEYKTARNIGKSLEEVAEGLIQVK